MQIDFCYLLEKLKQYSNQVEIQLCKQKNISLFLFSS